MGNKSYEATVQVSDDHSIVQNYPCKELVGIPILEVYSMTYLGSSPMEAEDQIGSISMKTDDIFYRLYYETKVDSSKPSIEYGDQLPIRNIGPICSFTDLDLKFDLGIHEGSRKVSVRSPEGRDWLLKSGMKSKDGYMGNISILFGCFLSATVANVKVRLLNIPSIATTNVYGVIMATNSKFDHHACTSYLFSQNSDSTVQVEYNGLIPLSKSRIAVPLDSRLYVNIFLFCNGLHYIGTAEFTPGEESKLVADKILVKITWNCDEDWYSTDEDSTSTDYDSDIMDEDKPEYDLATEYEFDSNGVII
ncbi:uncharacterized protein LOC141663662 [Apium graveolens]|uniref:uncharacterized protein LOC141663662 n=1 Tax=Apium graveolens TaxID=4045 RepID=UPI003D7A9203